MASPAHEAEQKLETQEMELRQILDLSPQLIAVFGPRFERLFTNRIGLDYFGLTLDEWRDTAPGAVGHPDDVKATRPFFSVSRAESISENDFERQTPVMPLVF